MELSELIDHQHEWQTDRGIVNGNWGADRIQVELDEAKEEADPYKKLVEYADVIIITAGSVGALLEYLDLEAEEFNKIITEKVARNDLKYPQVIFDFLGPEEAQRICRAMWVEPE